MRKLLVTQVESVPNGLQAKFASDIRFQSRCHFKERPLKFRFTQKPHPDYHDKVLIDYVIWTPGQSVEVKG